MTEITTFAASTDTIDVAISSGADHLILEHPLVCIRSYSDHFDDTSFSHLEALVHHMSNHHPAIRLSANCDLLFHQRHLTILTLFLKTCQKLSLSTIRIQDPGLIGLIQEVYPQANITLAMEIGNHNHESIRYFSLCCTRQVLSNELPKEDMAAFKENIKTEFECQVHGPILIQYSNRRYLTGAKKTPHTNDSTPIKTRTQDQQYPGRLFTFYDNPHGHMMYAYFDRCLYRHIEDLKNLNLTAWLIDGRGQTNDYLTTALKTYKSALLSDDPNPFNTHTWNHLVAVSPRALKAGFFRANKTDQVRESGYVAPDTTTQYIGEILDVIKDRVITIETECPLHVGDNLLICTHKKQIPITVSRLSDIWGNDIKSSIPYQLVIMAWIKGVSAKAKVYRSRKLYSLHKFNSVNIPNV